jgi:hypothetical protein
MKTIRLARRLGLDGNPLRRRTDKIAIALAALLVTVFLIGAPWLAAAAVGWAGRAAHAGGRSTLFSHRVLAVLLQTARVPATSAEAVLGYSLVRARWTAPDGQERTGAIPVSTDLAAGQTVPLLVDASGAPGSPAPNPRSVFTWKVAAATAATAALGIVLLCLASAGRWAIDRRRIAHWEAEWAAVGPQWTKRFRSRG